MFDNEKIKLRLERAIKERVFPGCVFGVMDRSGNAVVMPVGHFTYENDSKSVDADTVFDIASITKSLAGTSSLLKLVDEGKLSLDDKVVDFIPEFGNFENKKQVTIKHILTYSLEFELPPMSSLKDLSPEELYKKGVEAPLRAEPGLRYFYTNATAGLFAPIIKAVTGKRIDQYADESFFAPLGMTKTTFHPEEMSKEGIAPTEIDDWRGRTIQGEVHDESSYVMSKIGPVAIAGVFSTTPDLLKFVRMLLAGGDCDGRRYFKEETIREMYTPQIPNAEPVGLGWAIPSREILGCHFSSKTFYKSGFTGCHMAIDMEKGIGMVLLSNRTYPKRAKDQSSMNALRRDIADMILKTS